MNLLAAPGVRSYLGVTLAVTAAACARPPAPPAPSGGFAPLSAGEFAAFAARTAPQASQLLQLRWRYQDGDRQVNGRGAARLAPPDSLRLDLGVPILGRATVVLMGDSAWAQPDAIVDQVLPSRFILWAIFGIVRAPGPGTRLEAGDAPDRRLYRLTAPDSVMTVLECRGDTLLGATQLRGDEVLGRLTLSRDSAGAVVRSVATDVEQGVRFTVVVTRRETSEAFPSEIWRHP